MYYYETNKTVNTQDIYGKSTFFGEKANVGLKSKSQKASVINLPS